MLNSWISLSVLRTNFSDIETNNVNESYYQNSALEDREASPEGDLLGPNFCKIKQN